MEALGAGQGDRAEDLDFLIDRVKAYQRSGPQAKEQWWTYCRRRGSADFDPKRHDVKFLLGFLKSGGSGLEELHDKNGLVQRVKEIQRTSVDHRKLWHTWCQAMGTSSGKGPDYDPQRHDERNLRHFIDAYESGTLQGGKNGWGPVGAASGAAGGCWATAKGGCADGGDWSSCNEGGGKGAVSSWSPPAGGSGAEDCWAASACHGSSTGWDSAGSSPGACISAQGPEPWWGDETYGNDADSWSSTWAPGGKGMHACGTWASASSTDMGDYGTGMQMYGKGMIAGGKGADACGKGMLAYGKGMDYASAAADAWAWAASMWSAGKGDDNGALAAAWFGSGGGRAKTEFGILDETPPAALLNKKRGAVSSPAAVAAGAKTPGLMTEEEAMEFQRALKKARM